MPYESITKQQFKNTLKFVNKLWYFVQSTTHG